MTAVDRAAVAALEEAVLALCQHRADTAARIERTLALDPELALAHALRGFGAKLLARTDMEPVALDALRNAQRSLRHRGGTPREVLVVRALEHWCQRDADAAVASLDRALAIEPLDLLAIKLSHALQFMLGRPHGMLRSIERVLPAWSSDGDAVGRRLVLGCHAFALEELGELDQAERAGLLALEQEDAVDPWAVHAVAHVHHSRRAPRRVLEWLGANERCREGANNFGAHVCWHRALALLSLGRDREAVALYDEQILLPRSPDYRDLVNSTTLLLRLEQHGLEVGDRWEQLAAIAAERAGHHRLGFADVHCVLALAQAGRARDASRFVRSMRESAEGMDGAEATISLEVGVPAAQAALALRIDPLTTITLLTRHARELPRLGGSRAQREVFEILLDLARAACEVPATGTGLEGVEGALS